MTLELLPNARTRIRPPVAAFTAACGAATAIGSLLTWVSAHGARPGMGMAHTSLAQMLVYTYAVASLQSSVAFVMLILGAVMAAGALTGVRTLAVLGGLLALAASGMWIGLVVHHFNTPGLPDSHYLNPVNLPWAELRAGAWLTLTGAALGLVSAFWLRRAASQPDSRKA
ncbi:MAG TPA: hypothetical protein VE343_13950 [Streptosporangiaceae bacterium]|nr:hypothetical protein [Streptosporangiaceae bacterium]